MAVSNDELTVFAWLPGAQAERFVPAGLLQLTETIGTRPQDRELASRFAYGLRYLDRPAAFEIDPVSLSIAERDIVRGRALFPLNGLSEFGGVRDAAPDAWGRRVIEAQRKVPANSLTEAEYLLAAGGDRVGALDVRRSPDAPDSPSASDIRSLAYVAQAADAVEQGVPIPTNLEPYLGAGPSAGGARPKASVRDEDGGLWLAKFPAKGDSFDVARAEVCTLELARRCGLSVPELRYLHVGARPVMLIRRFDRYWSAAGELPASSIELHHTRPRVGLCEGHIPYVSGLSLVACSEFDSRNRGYHDLAHAIHRYADPARIRRDCEELFARLVFNIFVSNDDDHLRNHAFLRDPRTAQWSLSPLYDVLPRPGVAHERTLHLEVGAQGKLATLDNALTGFAAFTPSRSRAIEIIHRVWCEVREWKTTFEAHGADDQLIGQVASAFRDLSHIASSSLETEIRRNQ